MKSLLAHSYVKLTTVVITVVPLAVMCGWSTWKG